MSDLHRVESLVRRCLTEIAARVPPYEADRVPVSIPSRRRVPAFLVVTMGGAALLALAIGVVGDGLGRDSGSRVEVVGSPPPDIVTGDWAGGRWIVERDGGGCLRLVLSGERDTGTGPVCGVRHPVAFFAPQAAAGVTPEGYNAGPWLYFGVFDASVAEIELRRTDGPVGGERVVPTVPRDGEEGVLRFAVFEVDPEEVETTPSGSAEFVFRAEDGREIHRLAVGPDAWPPET